jgi:hypothetical protein
MAVAVWSISQWYFGKPPQYSFLSPYICLPISNKCRKTRGLRVVVVVVKVRWETELLRWDQKVISSPPQAKPMMMWPTMRAWEEHTNIPTSFVLHSYLFQDGNDSGIGWCDESSSHFGIRTRYCLRMRWKMKYKRERERLAGWGGDDNVRCQCWSYQKGSSLKIPVNFNSLRYLFSYPRKISREFRVVFFTSIWK